MECCLQEMWFQARTAEVGSGGCRDNPWAPRFSFRDLQVVSWSSFVTKPVALHTLGVWALLVYTVGVELGGILTVPAAPLPPIFAGLGFLWPWLTWLLAREEGVQRDRRNNCWACNFSNSAHILEAFFHLHHFQSSILRWLGCKWIALNVH